jgi:hypothetical protein
MVEAMNVRIESLWKNYMVLVGWMSLNSSVEIPSTSQSRNQNSIMVTYIGTWLAAGHV